MGIIAFVVGCLVGVLLTLYCVASKSKGTLKVIWDTYEGEPYMFLEVSRANVAKITSAKYTILEVEEDVRFSHK